MIRFHKNSDLIFGFRQKIMLTMSHVLLVIIWRKICCHYKVQIINFIGFIWRNSNWLYCEYMERQTVFSWFHIEKKRVIIQYNWQKISFKFNYSFLQAHGSYSEIFYCSKSLEMCFKCALKITVSFADFCSDVKMGSNFVFGYSSICNSFLFFLFNFHSKSGNTNNHRTGLSYTFLKSFQSWFEPQ